MLVLVEDRTRERQLERTAALLPRDQAGHRPVDLVHQKAFRPHRQEPQHAVERRRDVDSGRQLNGLGCRDPPIHFEGLLRDVAEHVIEHEIDRG